MANHTQSLNYVNDNDNDYIEDPPDPLEDAERVHKLSQVRMELFRG